MNFEGTIRENIPFCDQMLKEERFIIAVKAGYVNEFTDRFDDGLDIH
jgi:subfamily B ATP-binding cassette protein MsbA